MVSQQTRNELWQELYDIERSCRYYESMYTRTARAHFWIRLVTLLLIAGSITAIMGLLPFSDLFKAVVVASVTSLTIWDAVSNYPKKAAVAHAIHFHCSRVRTDLRDLWLLVYDEAVDDGDMRERVRQLARMSQEAENWAGFSDIQVDGKLNEKTSEDARKVLESRYNVEQREAQ